jgi:hypothetical protein
LPDADSDTSKNKLRPNAVNVAALGCVGKSLE